MDKIPIPQTSRAYRAVGILSIQIEQSSVGPTALLVEAIGITIATSHQHWPSADIS